MMKILLYPSAYIKGGVEDEGRKRCEDVNIEDYVFTVPAPRTFLLQASLLQNKYLRNQKKKRKCKMLSMDKQRSNRSYPSR